MTDPQIKDEAAHEAAAAVADYEHGWSSDIETEFAPKGLSEDTVRFISAKKNEPEWMLEWRLGAFRRDEAAIARRVEELLEIFNLGRFRDAPAKSLPYGEQRRLDILRCHATNPQHLMPDGPAAQADPAAALGLLRLLRTGAVVPRARAVRGCSCVHVGVCAPPAPRRLREVARCRTGCKTRRDQQRVEILRRQLEHPRQAKHHGASGLRAPGLEKTEMTRRHTGVECEFLLAHCKGCAPETQQPPERAWLMKTRGFWFDHVVFRWGSAMLPGR